MDFDLEADLWAQTPFSKRECEPPATILEWRKQAKLKQSIYDVDPEEQALYQEIANKKAANDVILIRGRPIILKPDQKPGNIEFHRKTQESIREVCGIGHSNEASESYIKLLQRESRETMLAKKKKLVPDEELYSDIVFDESHVKPKDNVKYSVLK